MAFKKTDNKLYVRDYLNITSKELAIKVGISEVTASNIINNKTTPSLSTLKKIAEVLNVSVSKLLGESAEEVQPQKGDDVCAFVRFRASNNDVHLHADTWADFWAMVDEIASSHPRKQP